MNSCVNTRSKEFKNLCSKYDVSSEKMELLIHQYWNERNSDTEYPSNAYIEAHLGKSPYQESIDSVVKIWEKDYSKSKIFNSDKELKEAQNKAARFFPSEAIVSYTNNQGKYVLTIRKPVKNIKEAYRKAIENGSWDDGKRTNNNQDIEDIQMYISSNEDKSSNKTYFTFKDGTQVKAPFVVNVQQEAALNALDNFVKSNANVITLSGYAGTGKTSIMQIFKEKMDKEGVPVTFTAATNKAANVLKTKVKDAQTLHSAFGIQAGVDYNSEYDLKHLINTVKENDLLPGSVVVIDEASMIDDNIYKILNKIALDQNLKIIYLGDKAQLAPVNSAQISPIFRNKEGKVLELTKVERTGDNAILKEATGLRTKGIFSYVSSFNKDGKGVAFINPSKNREEIENIIKAFTAKIQNDPDYFRILAYRNNTISKYNDYVRKILGYDIKNNPNDYYPHENEPIVGYNNWGYLKTRKGHTYRFINSESYKTIDATAPVTNIELSVPNGKVYTITAKPVVVQKTDGTEDTLNFIDVRGNQDNRKAVTEIANVISYLWRKRKTVPFSEQNEILQEINKLQTALFVNDNIEENGRTIVQKIWDFGYAMTVHKSQGSTFKNVIIDDKDIQSARKNSEGIEYVDLGDSQEETVSKDQMDAILSSQEESIDSDITAAILTDQGEEVSSIPTKVKETKEVDINDTMDTVRQLEYVAVSRATDTATVITDMAKVEDSPLNHEANQFSKTDEHKSSVNPKDNTTNPVIQRSDNEITKQVVSHLKSIPGIKVFDRNAMEEFLKTHNITGLQQMVDNNSQINKKDYNDEEQSIIDEAKKKGTFMKAPNGKPTNLTERQWVQVRTKAFKEWFGDWERVANSSKFNKRDHVSNSITSATYQGVSVSEVKFDPDMAPDGGTRIIFLGDKYIGEIPVVESKDKIRMSGSIGTATEIEEEYRGKGYGKKAHLALANIAKSEGKTLYSDSSNSDAEDALWKSLVKDGIAEVVSESSKDEHWNHTTYRIINDKLPQADNINSGDRGVSKVVDENGEPLVVYHNTPFEFNGIFDMNHKSRIMPWTSEPFGHVGTQETANKIKGTQFALFLNIRNPLETPDFVHETVNSMLSELYKQGIISKEKYSSLRGISNSELRNLMLSLGYDGTKYENKAERGGTSYSFITPNQIKSATDNVGTFSRTNDDITTFTTPQGEVYGFVDKDGNIYLDETKISPEHPIHEYTHLWDRIVQQKNSKLWNRGVELMKQTTLWNEILNSEHYGKAWQQLGINGKKLDNLIASEVHARLTGTEGEALLKKLADKKGQSNIISKLKDWLLDIWKTLGETFGVWNKESLDNLTLEDFNHLTIRDFVKGYNPVSNTFMYNDELNVQSNNIQTEGIKVEYTPVGKIKQIYTIKESHIYNKEGKEVFTKDSIDRNKIFANLAVLQGRAVVVQHKNSSYVVNDRDQIISITSGKIMKWGQENGDRKAILEAAKEKFEKKNINKQSSQNNQQTPTKDFKLYRTIVSSYSGDITPDANTIFVFGSNPEGRHGAGAAKIAREKFGAIYGQGEGLQGNAYALPTKRIKSITSVKTGRMTFSYGTNKRSDVKSNTTLEAIINGERTATTRYSTDGHIDYWKDLKVGDIVAFTSADRKTTVYVKITKPLTQLNSSTNAEEWSKKEGWSVEYYNSKVKPKVEKGQAYQMEYEFVDANGE